MSDDVKLTLQLETDRERDRQTEGQEDRGTGRQRDRKTEEETDRQTGGVE